MERWSNVFSTGMGCRRKVGLALIPAGGTQEQYEKALALHNGFITKTIAQLGYPARRRIFYNQIARLQILTKETRYNSRASKAFAGRCIVSIR